MRILSIFAVAAILALSGCQTTTKPSKDPIEVLSEMEEPESMDHVLMASKIGKAAIQYKRAFGRWPSSPKSLGKKLTRPIDFDSFEGLRFSVNREDIFIITFKMHGVVDFTIENQPNNDPITKEENKKYRDRNYRIEID